MAGELTRIIGAVRRGVAAPLAAIDGFIRRADDWFDAGPWWRRSLRDLGAVGAVVVLLGALVARTALDAGIAKIHAVGTDGTSTNSLHDGTAAIERAFQVWGEGDVRLREVLRYGGTGLAAAQTICELIAALLAMIVGYRLLAVLRRRLDTGDRTSANVVVEIASGGVLLYGVLGVVNQALELWILARHGPLPGPLDGVLFVSARLRSAMVPLMAVAIVVGLVEIDRRDRRAQPPRHQWWRGIVMTYRVLIVIVVGDAALLLFSIPGAQTQDALRLWPERWSLPLFGLVTTAALSVSLGLMAVRIGTSSVVARRVMTRRQTVALLVLGLSTIAAGAVATAVGHTWSAAAYGAGSVAVVIALLSLPLIPAEQPVAERFLEPTDVAREVVPAVLATVPPIALALVLIRALVPSVMDDDSSLGLAPYAVAALVLAVVTYAGTRAFARWAFDAGARAWAYEGPDEATPKRFPWPAVEAVLLGGCAIVYGVVIARPFGAAPVVGVLGILTTFLLAVVIVFGSIGFGTDAVPLPAFFDFIGFRRLPVVLSLVAWGLASHLFAERGYHDLQTSGRLPDAPQLTVTTGFDRWRTANLGDAVETDEPAETRRAVPMIFVAAAGGGLKAATFTAAALDEIFGAEPGSDPWPRVFAASGASGGSVGIASVAAARASGAAATDDWVARSLGNDLLSPELAWQVFVEVPNAFANFDPGLDRGEILQETWRRQFAAEAGGGDTDPGAAPYYRDRSAGPWDGPLLFLSGTNLIDGCRVNISAVRSSEHVPHDPHRDTNGPSSEGPCDDRRSEGEPSTLAASRDLVDYLCGDNIDLATAAFLSARFPVVSATGTTKCADGEPATNDALSIGDAGYRDNSGASSVMDVWRELEPLVTRFNDAHTTCIVPIFLEINTGYRGLGAISSSPEVAQLIAPALGALNVFGQLSYGEIEQAASEFSSEVQPGLTPYLGEAPLQTRFFRIGLVDHPGVTAPLGWSLSEGAAEDLVQQLDLGTNRRTVEVLERVLRPEGDADALACRSVTGRGG